MPFLSSLNIVGSALTAHRKRVDVITQNLANMSTTATERGGPYVRQQVILKEQPLSFRNVLNQERFSSQRNQDKGGVIVEQIVESNEPFIPVYNPSHPDANEEGYVLMPNVNRTEEQIDLMAASRAYEANLTALNIMKSMAMKAMEIGK
ncbi:MAG: flagellar basal body rod protein FlgC [Erysipelothrix sp.]|nr:flagellar basal body rod protein FlgC [Erysipelothrix sp.]